VSKDNIERTEMLQQYYDYLTQKHYADYEALVEQRINEAIAEEERRSIRSYTHVEEAS
jgi:hypothetical protein